MGVVLLVAPGIMRTLRFILIWCGWANVTVADPVVTEHRGQAIYRDNCMECHLESGKGIVGLGVPSIAGLPRWYVTDQLREFRREVRGSHDEDQSGRLMQMKAKSLGDRELAFVGRHIESLPPSSERATLDLPVAAEGHARYLADCASCQGANGEGDRSRRAPPLTRQPDWYLLKQLENFREGKRQHHKKSDEVEAGPSRSRSRGVGGMVGGVAGG